MKHAVVCVAHGKLISTVWHPILHYVLYYIVQQEAGTESLERQNGRTVAVSNFADPLTDAT